MKLKFNKKGQAGMTLIEITLVIAVLLGLISVLFIGVAAYKKGSDRAKCILNISTMQKAVRSYQNLNELDEGDALASTLLIGAGLMFEATPVCSAGGAYGFAGVVPATNTPYLTCSLAGSDNHAPTTTDGW